jgi:hypothetical protein
MSTPLKAALLRAAARILEPLVRLLLEAGVGTGEFHALIKAVYVRVAQDSAPLGARPNASRIAVLTGLTRADVTSLLNADASAPNLFEWDRSRAERVLTGWWNDPHFREPHGTPLALPLRGGSRSFAALVKKYAGEPRTVTILEELMRVKAVHRRPDGKLEPLSRTVATVRWDPAGIENVGERMRDHLDTLIFNLQHPSRPRYTRVVTNTQLDPHYAPLILRDITQHTEVAADAIERRMTEPVATLKAGRSPRDALRVTVSFHIAEESFVLEAKRPSTPRAGKG